jgi:hypothetical protein
MECPYMLYFFLSVVCCIFVYIRKQLSMESGFLSPREIRRYSKQIMIPEIGQEGQEKLKKTKVLVVGAGGLGCPVLQYLTAAGIGKIGIVEFDPAAGFVRFSRRRKAESNYCQEPSGTS